MSATQIRFHFNEQTFARAPFICCLVNCISDKMSLLSMSMSMCACGYGFSKINFKYPNTGDKGGKQGIIAQIACLKGFYSVA